MFLRVHSEAKRETPDILQYRYTDTCTCIKHFQFLLPVRSTTGPIVFVNNPAFDPRVDAMSSFPLPAFRTSFPLNECIFDRDIDDQLPDGPGGHFGIVVFGTWRFTPVGGGSPRNIPIAMKVFDESKVSGRDWLEEIQVMTDIRDLGPAVSGKRHLVTVLGMAFYTGRTRITRLVMVMERLDRSLEATLKDCRARGVHYSLEILVEWMLGAARALEALHDYANIVHGDIKMDNMMLAKKVDGPEHICKLIDFGLSRRSAGYEHLLYRGQGARGALGYHSPELLQHPENCTNTKASDVYALGIACWCMLACEAVPYQKEHFEDPNTSFDETQFRRDIIAGVRPTAPLRSDTPPRLIALIKRCLSGDIDARPSAATLRFELEAIRNTVWISNIQWSVLLHRTILFILISVMVVIYVYGAIVMFWIVFSEMSRSKISVMYLRIFVVCYAILAGYGFWRMWLDLTRPVKVL
jgi:serine/threonine protein kinase